MSKSNLGIGQEKASAMPKASTAHSSTPHLCKPAGFAILLVFACFQVAFASHQFEHRSGDLLEVCTVCNHMERLDAIAPCTPVGLSSSALLPRLDPQPARPVAAKVIRSYETRAPPSA